jgi:N-acetylglucosaminyldiphosphoundecaprenol N-acetyl-beta-D-mannosaminyltransferase
MEPMKTPVMLLGIPIDAITRRQAVELMTGYAKSDEQHHIMTPNPEMLVEAARNIKCKNLLMRTDLNLADGVGLLWAARYTGQYLPERVSGVDVLSDLCAQPDFVPVFLLGASPGVAEKAAAVLQKKNPSLVIAGTYAGSPRVEEEKEIIEHINASGARVLFVAYGAPQQDEWIKWNLQHLPDVRLAMGVGGSFDFLAGVRSRAPGWMRSLGLEWFWRLVQEPKRIGRIFTAVVVFPWLVIAAGRHADSHT